jgi:hypothetical protein
VNPAVFLARARRANDAKAEEPDPVEHRCPDCLTLLTNGTVGGWGVRVQPCPVCAS